MATCLWKLYLLISPIISEKFDFGAKRIRKCDPSRTHRRMHTVPVPRGIKTYKCPIGSFCARYIALHALFTFGGLH